MTAGSEHGRPGVGVDAHGGAVIDPTANVLDLVSREIQRIDDVAEVHALLTDEKIKRMEQTAIHLKEIADLRAEHNKDIRRMESDRVDKIRSVDVANAAATATQLLNAVTTLATTAQGTAETLRSQVATTAGVATAAQERLINPLVERISALEKSSYTGAGRAGVADPQMERLTVLVENLARGRANDTGKVAGIGASWGVLLGIAGLVGTVFTVGGVLVGLVLWLAARGGP